MKKLVAALLVLTMTLALVGSAMADCSKFEKGACVKFTKNTVAYNHKGGKATSTIVRKGSLAIINQVCGNWVKLELDYTGVTRWFKTDNLVVTTKGKYIPELDAELYIYVTYSNGGVSKSSELITFDDDDPVGEGDLDNWRISPDCYKHVKATATVWLHKESSLKKNYGVALHKGDKVTYRRRWGWDSRFIRFYGVKYKGKCLWVSSRYSKWVK
jgi:hypothetical protein